jgi:hypothetical protein
MQSVGKSNVTVFAIALFVLLLSSSFDSLAGNIGHINIGRIAVDDQSLRSQQRAGKLALAQVFVKLSGNQNVVNEPEIAKAIDNYEQFLISSSFITQELGLVFEATFNRAKVENLLTASGLTVWASLRPSAVVWLASENRQRQKVLMSQYTQSALAQKIDLKAFARGVEIITPLGDLLDTQQLSVYDVWNQFISKLQDTSLRYKTDYLISATVQPYNQAEAELDQSTNADFFTPDKPIITVDDFPQSSEPNPIELMQSVSDEDNETAPTSFDLGNDYQIDDERNLADTKDIIVTQRLRATQRSNLLANIPVPEGTTHKLDYIITYVDFRLSKKVETGRIFGESEDDLVLQLIDVYANMLALEFASGTQSEIAKQSITVSFSGIDSLQDYVDMMALVQSIPAVNSVRLVKQINDVAILDVDQKITISQLKSILSIDSRLAFESTLNNASVSFRWQGK